MSLPPPPFTPETLADRWSCSPDAIRRLCRAGRLACFHVGKGMYRIRQDVVEEYERRDSSSIEAGGTPSGPPQKAPSVAPSVPKIVIVPRSY